MELVKPLKFYDEIYGNLTIAFVTLNGEDIMRKTKIICTLGPATDSEEMITGLIENGMNVARLNFSHGSYDEHSRRIDMVKRVRERLGAPVGIMLDTKGPEIRLGIFDKRRVELGPGQVFTLTSKEIVGNEERASISYEGLPKEVEIGTRILIDDGLIEMEVEEKNADEVKCRVKNGGIVSDRKSVNVPDITLNVPFVSDKDRQDLLFGIEKDVDFIAASFTRSAADIMEMKRILEANNGVPRFLSPSSLHPPKNL